MREPSRSPAVRPRRRCRAGRGRSGSRSSAARSPSSATGREKLSNTSCVYDPEGELVAVYRKIHLFDVEVGGHVYRESEAEEPGAEPVLARAEDWRIGLTVCYDVRFPELYRILALEGAELATVPAHFTTPTGKDHWHVLLRARAIENQYYVAAAGQVGETLPGKPAYGRSLIVDPWGIVLAQAPDEETVIVAELDRARLREIRAKLPSLANRQARRVPVADASDDRDGARRARCRRARRALAAAPRRGVPARRGGVRVRAELARRDARRAEALESRIASPLQEADALERWDGDGAVRLLARDDERNALLLERCVPGTFLSGWDGDALDVLIGLLPRLWKSGDGFHYARGRDGRLDRRDRARRPRPALKDAALHYIRELAPTQGEQVLVHQDLHGENVLAAQREPWLVIDPKPLAGEREFAVASIVRSIELGHSKRDALYRLDRLTAELGLDRERARGWTIAQTVAWSGGSDYVGPHIETVHWLLEDA